ncbi:MAG: error-prone DNA polymerase, partial [Sphingobacteriaceae bacterium]
AIVAAGFTPAEADALRRSMATFKFKGMVNHFEQKLVDGMKAKGYEEEFARKIFRQLEGFGSYGFPESHAASFALLVYVSCWLKCYYPDVFATALLNSLPMGFYEPAQLVIDARRHGVQVRQIDVNHSHWDNIMQEKSGKYYAIRLGFRQITGIRESDIEALVAGRLPAYTSIPALLDTGVPQPCLEKLADADAFRSLGLDRRQALWEVSALHDRPVELFKGQPSESVTETQISLPFMSQGEHVVQDYASTSLSLKAHPVSFVRQELRLLHGVSSAEFCGIKDGIVVKTAGLVLVRQRPGTAKGVCFITLEDEDGTINLVIFGKIYELFRKEILNAKLLLVEGKLQRESGVTNVIVSRCFDMSKLFRKLMPAVSDEAPLLTLSQADEKITGSARAGLKISPMPKTETKMVLPAARNFK